MFDRREKTLGVSSEIQDQTIFKMKIGADEGGGVKIFLRSWPV